MAERLVDDMSDEWTPGKYKDTYTGDLMERIEDRIKAGQTHVITPESDETHEPHRGAEVIDLVSMLRRSLEQTEKGGAANDEKAPRETAAERPKRAAARKAPSRISSKSRKRA